METTAAPTPASHGPWKFEMRNCGTANETPATTSAGQTSAVFLKPQKAQTSQKGMIREKNGSCRPTIALSCRISRPVTPARATMGVPSAPKATGAVLAMSESPDAASGAKPRPMRMAAVTATGVPNPAAPSKNAPNEKAMSRSWRRRSAVTPVRLSCMILKAPVSQVRS